VVKETIFNNNTTVRGRISTACGKEIEQAGEEEEVGEALINKVIRSEAGGKED